MSWIKNECLYTPVCVYLCKSCIHMHIHEEVVGYALKCVEEKTGQ